MLKALLIQLLLLGPSALTTAVPTEGEETVPFGTEIRPSELNDYLHPDAVYTQGAIDCADGEPILQGGATIGCLFFNTAEAVENAVDAIAAAKNLTDVQRRSFFEGSAPAFAPPSHQLKKRALYYISNTFCHQSGVYTKNSDVDLTKLKVCPIMDSYAGRGVKSVSWTFVSKNDFLDPMYAVSSTTQIKHDYFFLSNVNKPDQDWVFSSFRGECSRFIEWTIRGQCVGGSGTDTRGGWSEGYDPDYGNYQPRLYRLGVDPNPLSGSG